MGKRSGSQSRRGSSSSVRSVGEKEPSLLKKSVVKGQQASNAIVGEAVKSIAKAEKELLGAEKALRDFRAGIKDRPDESPTPGGKQAMEEEFVPVVSDSRVFGHDSD